MEVPLGSDNEALTGLSFATEAAQATAHARRQHWRRIWSISIGLITASALLSLTANGFYRLSVARTHHWPSSLVLPTLNFEVADPIHSAFVADNACEGSRAGFDVADEAEAGTCGILTALIRGDLADAARLMRSLPASSRELTPSLKEALSSQLADSAHRRDWASCSAASWFSLQLLEHQDSAPNTGQGSDNRLLLLAASCQSARMAYLAADDFSELATRISTGEHLDGEWLRQLVDHPAPIMQAWAHYLSGIAQLRARNNEGAASSFKRAEAIGATGLLRDLTLLGLARALFWQYTLASLGPSRAPATTSNDVRRELEAIGRSLQRSSFRTDVSYYVRELR